MQPQQHALPPILPQQPRRVPWVAVVVFIVFACGLAWLTMLPLWQARLSGSSEQNFLTLFAPNIMMLTPTVSVIVTMLLFRRRMKWPEPGQLMRQLGVWPLRPAKRTVWTTVVLLLAASYFTVFVVFLAAAFGWYKLDLAQFSGYAQTLGSSLGSSADQVDDSMVGALAIGAVAAAPLNAVLVVAVFALGEEIGWRGFLLPALRPLGPVPALVLTGAIWGFWHTPIILLGHNFGLFDMRGVALMIVGCVLVGIVFGWSRLRTGSVWPAVFGHAGLNAGSSALLALRSADDPENLVFVNPLGIAGWIITLAVIIVLIITKQFDREGRLGYSRRQLEKLTPQPAAETGGADQVRLSQNDQTDQD